MGKNILIHVFPSFLTKNRIKNYLLHVRIFTIFHGYNHVHCQMSQLIRHLIHRLQGRQEFTHLRCTTVSNNLDFIWNTNSMVFAASPSTQCHLITDDHHCCWHGLGLKFLKHSFHTLISARNIRLPPVNDSIIRSSYFFQCLLVPMLLIQIGHMRHIR